MLGLEVCRGYWYDPDHLPALWVAIMPGCAEHPQSPEDSPQCADGALWRPSQLHQSQHARQTEPSSGRPAPHSLANDAHIKGHKQFRKT